MVSVFLPKHYCFFFNSCRLSHMIVVSLDNNPTGAGLCSQLSVNISSAMLSLLQLQFSSLRKATWRALQCHNVENTVMFFSTTIFGNCLPVDYRHELFVIRSDSHVYHVDITNCCDLTIFSYCAVASARDLCRFDFFTCLCLTCTIKRLSFERKYRICSPFVCCYVLTSGREFERSFISRISTFWVVK